MQRIISTLLVTSGFVAAHWTFRRRGGGHGRRWEGMLRPYIVYYKFKVPTDKTQGAVKQFRIYAASLDEARRLASRHANYPNIEVLNIKPA